MFIPPYQLLLRGWMALFGSGELATRFLSFLFGGLGGAVHGHAPRTPFLLLSPGCGWFFGVQPCLGGLRLDASAQLWVSRGH